MTVLLFSLSGDAFGIARDGSGNVSGMSGTAGSSLSSSLPVEKRTAIVTSQDSSTLYTNLGNFSLAGVVVQDLTKGQELPKNRKKTAELTFVNGVLKEVVIRQ